jgi:diaminohydroxyphosphoribosylaminopyrimidine deaminase/5-amino-6-(5-phosphoribosylamino)uracil reductase
MMNLAHEKYMLRAIELASQGSFYTKPNPNVGCVIVDPSGEIISEGYHQFFGGHHAEVEAIKQAGSLEKEMRGSTFYVTLEPCSHFGKTGPCADALIEAGIAKVFVALEDPNPQVGGNGISRLRQAGISVEVGLCADKAEELNLGFLKKHRQGRPFLRAKVAAGIDGKIAMENGESKWITNEDSRADVQIMRASAGAIITGMGTILADNPKLTARPLEPNYTFSQPYRVVIDRNLEIPLDANIIGIDGLCVVVTQTENELKVQRLSNLKVKVLKIDFTDTSVLFDTLLVHLARMGVNDVMVESGPRLISQFIKYQLLDELVVYTAPCLMGVSAISMTNIELESMAERIQYKLQSVKRFGDDIKCVYRFV